MSCGLAFFKTTITKKKIVKHKMKTLKTLKTGLVTLVALALGIASVQATTYDNSSISSGIVTFGNSNTATYGQTFTAPGGVLDSWTFYLQNEYVTPQNFEFFVFGWNGSSATGPALYQSSLQTVTPSETAYTPFTVNPNLALTAGQQYVMFINESGLNGSTDGFIAQGGSGSSPLGGEFVYLNNGDDFSQVTSTAWKTYVFSDSAYIADFSSGVPDGGMTLAMLGAAVSGLSFLRRKH
jgi:hypothetical protein